MSEQVNANDYVNSLTQQRNEFADKCAVLMAQLAQVQKAYAKLMGDYAAVTTASPTNNKKVRR